MTNTPRTQPLVSELGIAVDVVAGHFTATLEYGAIRWLTANGVELVRGVYGAVRDQGWGTVPPRLVRYDLERRERSFSLSFTAEVRREDDGIDFEWDGLVTGAEDGTIRFDFDGIVRRSFPRARIGLCVLHPARLAGTAVEVQTPWGTMHGRFPDRVAALSPFTNIIGLHQEPHSSREIRIAFNGDLFEMEDQRAFGDASFKTFSTPLSLPWPVRVEAGTRIRQAVTVEPRGSQHSGRQPPHSAPPRARRLLVSVGGQIGKVPPVGACAPPAGTRINRLGLSALASLGLAYLRADIDLDGSGWRDDLTRVAGRGAALGVDLEVALIGRGDHPAMPRAVARLATLPVSRLLQFDPERHTTSPIALHWLRELSDASGLRALVGGGSRGYFWHLGANGLDPALADFISFPLTPQVHASDDASIMESIEALPPLVRSAAALAPGRPIIVGPVSLRPLFDPDRVGPPPAPPAGQLPTSYDARQTSMLAAAWMLGSFAALASSGVSAVTFHELAGWGGLVAAVQEGLRPAPLAPGTPYPVFHVAASLAPLANASLLAVSAPRGIAALATVGQDGALRLVLANLDPTARRVSVTLPREWQGFAAGVSMLVPPYRDLRAPGGWTAPTPTPTRALDVGLGSYGIARVDVAAGTNRADRMRATA